jgi:hypothetical protein
MIFGKTDKTKLTRELILLPKNLEKSYSIWKIELKIRIN